MTLAYPLTFGLSSPLPGVGGARRANGGLNATASLVQSTYMQGFYNALLRSPAPIGFGCDAAPDPNPTTAGNLLCILLIGDMLHANDTVNITDDPGNDWQPAAQAYSADGFTYVGIWYTVSTYDITADDYVYIGSSSHLVTGAQWAFQEWMPSLGAFALNDATQTSGTSTQDPDTGTITTAAHTRLTVAMVGCTDDDVDDVAGVTPSPLTLDQESTGSDEHGFQSAYDTAADTACTWDGTIGGAWIAAIAGFNIA